MNTQDQELAEYRALRIYRIILFREGQQSRPVRGLKNLTLAEAQAHCKREDTHGYRAGKRWFHGYDYMPGCRPTTTGE